MDALGLGKLSVGAPYFNTIFVPLTTILAGLMGIGMFTRWKSTDPKRLLRELWAAALVSLVLALGLPFLFGEFNGLVFIGLLAAIWIALATVRDLLAKTSRREGRWYGLRQLSRSYWGMVLGHLGLGVMIVGIAGVSNFADERDLRMAPGDSVTMGRYVFQLDHIDHVEGPNFIADRAAVKVLNRDGEQVTVLYPEKRNYLVSRNVMTEAAIDPGLFRDLYVAMGEPLEGGAWAIRLHYKPFVRWIWLGAIFMALGGLLAVLDRRYRLPFKRESVQMPGAASPQTTATSAEAAKAS